MVSGRYWVAAERYGCTEKWTWCIRSNSVVEAGLATNAQSDAKHKGCLLWDGTFSDDHCRSLNLFICEVKITNAAQRGAKEICISVLGKM